MLGVTGAASSGSADGQIVVDMEVDQQADPAPLQDPLPAELVVSHEVQPAACDSVGPQPQAGDLVEAKAVGSVDEPKTVEPSKCFLITNYVSKQSLGCVGYRICVGFATS